MEYSGVAVLVEEKASGASSAMNTTEKRRFIECTPAQMRPAILPSLRLRRSYSVSHGSVGSSRQVFAQVPLNRITRKLERIFASLTHLTPPRACSIRLEWYGRTSVKHGFLNQKLGKRNSRRTELLKSKSFIQPSARPPKPSKHVGLGRSGRDS